MKTSDMVLELLKAHTANPLSGEEIAEKLQISRTSVWKAVNKLTNEGYVITAQRNSGYQLMSLADSLNKIEIEKGLSVEACLFCSKSNLENKLEVFGEIDSTNTEAKKRLSGAINSELLKGTILVAEKQTAGRGRLGRTFYSPAHNGIYMSIIFKPAMVTIDTTVMTSAAAVAVCRVLRKYSVKCEIKWVNDIFVNGKKVCGILTEGIVNLETGIIDAIILGIGINVFSTENFSKELQEIAGVVFSQNELSHPNRNELTAEIINEICAIFLHPEKIPDVMNEYRQNSMVCGKLVTVIAGEKEYEAKVLDITPEAHLIIETKTGEKKELLSGEVRIKPNAW